MHQWKYAITLILTLSITEFSLAANWVCGQDNNNNGNVADPGEIESCITLDGEKFCPLAVDCTDTSSNVCSTTEFTDSYSFSSSTYALYAGQSNNSGRHYYSTNSYKIELFNSRMKVGRRDGSFYVNLPENNVITPDLCREDPNARVSISFRDSRNNTQYTLRESPTCSNNMFFEMSYKPPSGSSNTTFSLTFTVNAQREVCTEEATYQCPLGDQYACLNNNGTYQCSQNACVDMDTEEPVVTDQISGEMLVDDGQRDSETGLCMDQLLIFSGKANECKTAGVSTAFQNCCDAGDGQILTDNMGSIYSVASSAKTIGTVYDIAQLSYYSYQASIATGASVAQASATAASAAQNGIMLSVDPASLAISVAVYFIMDYLTKACDAESMDTAIMSGSGYCHEIGEYCKEDWPLVGCVQEAKSYCCFNSKMARIIHEQGRPQLSTFGANSWGSVESPNCRGFTPEEFQTLDFSRIDLAEYYRDISAQTETIMQDRISEGVNEFYDTTR